MPDVWKKIKAEYIRGDASYRTLAKKYGVSFSTLRKVAAREKWTDLRNTAGTKRDTLLAESIGKKEARKADIFDTITDKLLQVINDGIEDGTLLATQRGLRDVTGALKDIREIKGIKSETDLQEQLARIEKLRKEAREETKETREIKVVIEGDLDDYSN